MNIGTIISMQTPGQTSAGGPLPKQMESKNGAVFSQLLGSVAQTAVDTEKQPDEGIVQLFNLLGILNAGEESAFNLKENPEPDFANILSLSGIAEGDIAASLSKLIENIQQEVPELRHMIRELISTNSEEGLHQLLEIISLMPAESLHKLNKPALELLIKAGKAFEQTIKYMDSTSSQAEKAENVALNLKSLAQKIEQLITNAGFKAEKWGHILEKVFRENSLGNAKKAVLNPNFKVNVEEIRLKSLTESLNNNLIQSVQTKITGAENKAAIEDGEKPALPKSVPLNPVLLGHHQMPKSEQFTMFVNKGQTGVSYEQFVKEFTNIIGRSQLVQTPNMSKLLIKLYPEQLGSLRIELLQQNGVMTAKILASTKTAKEMLDSQLNGLRQAFSSQNLQVDKIEVAQTLAESNRQEKQSSQQQNGQQQEEQLNQQSQANDEESGEMTFKDLLMNSEV